MSIERDKEIVFHEEGTLNAVTKGTGERRTCLECSMDSADFLGDRGLREVADARGRILFDKTDLERRREFQRTLTQRFAKELTLLDPDRANQRNR